MTNIDARMAIITTTDPYAPLVVENTDLIDQRHIPGQGFYGPLYVGHTVSAIEPAGLNVLSQGEKCLPALSEDAFRPLGHDVRAGRGPGFCRTNLLLVLASQ